MKNRLSGSHWCLLRRSWHYIGSHAWTAASRTTARRIHAEHAGFSRRWSSGLRIVEVGYYRQHDHHNGNHERGTYFLFHSCYTSQCEKCRAHRQCARGTA